MSKKSRNNAGKQAMLNEAKSLEAHGKKQKAKVAPDEAPEMPAMMAKGLPKELFAKKSAKKVK